MFRITLALVVASAAALGCGSDRPTASGPSKTALLVETPVTDPSFGFQTSKEVVLELSLSAPERRGQVQVEIVNEVGGVLFEGLVQGLKTELTLPVALPDSYLTVLVGPTQDARAIEVALDAPRIAVSL